MLWINGVVTGTGFTEGVRQRNKAATSLWQKEVCWECGHRLLEVQLAPTTWVSSSDTRIPSGREKQTSHHVTNKFNLVLLVSSICTCSSGLAFEKWICRHSILPCLFTKSSDMRVDHDYDCCGWQDFKRILWEANFTHETSIWFAWECTPLFLNNEFLFPSSMEHGSEKSSENWMWSRLGKLDNVNNKQTAASVAPKRKWFNLIQVHLNLWNGKMFYLNLFTESQITKWLRLNRTSWDHLVHLPCSDQD